jgi:hypothetical protein
MRKQLWTDVNSLFRRAVFCGTTLLGHHLVGTNMGSRDCPKFVCHWKCVAILWFSRKVSKGRVPQVSAIADNLLQDQWEEE